MNRLSAALLISAALASPATAFDIKAMSEEEKAAFGAAVREYLMENPQVLIESINVLETRQAEQSAQNDLELVAANSEAIFNDGHSWVGGNPDGDLTMVEFLDYRCGVCRQFNQEIFDAVKEDGNIRLILKEFPILGEESELSSRFAISVHQIAGDEAYKAAHDALITLRGPATIESLRKIADDIEVDADSIVQHMNTKAVTKVLRDNRQLAEVMAIQGTPTFVIGDQLLRGVPRVGVAETIAQIRETM
ncbi:DsbA family protein [Paracoccus rhizosphaerae]|uniref:DsbA family protein n=1 Tax=Paracoccus rhizosphaerae TaxID=1133347 RepID=A0ABV6CEM8_9RHOB|nr:DsbA family protein [Paracoccus rhizosphaerae]